MSKKVRVRYLEKRKLIKVGNAYYISVPKKIAEQMKIGVGDELLIFLTDDKRIVLKPAEQREELP